MRKGILSTPVALILGLSQTSAVGQSPIQFDAAAIKLDQRGPGDRRMRGGPGTSSPGRVTWQKVWLRDLMAVAFHVDPENVSGPDWISGNGAQLYLFTAILPPDTSRHDFELMFQRLLMEQFRIKLHHQPRLFPVYELVVATGGPRLKTSADPNAPAIPGYTAMKLDSEGFPVLLGLKLVKGEDTRLDTIVIDHAERVPLGN
ncbi:MAG TPA: TIGR03435 family protein [Bryobacteraceae bacterium]|nr:TIGR03435 family protein [Bryobacteraceae bacterium]